MAFNEVDQGGLTYIVKDIKVGATAPGQAGTSLSSTELILLDTVTAGTVTASKVLSVDANRDVATIRGITANGTFTRSGATGVNINALTDNLADALSYKEGANNYLTFVTTDNSESIASSQRLTTTDGVASGTARVVGGRSFSSTAAGTALTASVSETVLGSFTVPANSLKLGSVLRIGFQGIVTADNAATTLTVRLRVGTTTLTGTALITMAATDTSANFIFVGQADMVARAAPGAAAACVARTMWNDPAASGAAMKAGFLASTNFATSSALLVEVTGQWNASDANSCRLDILTVEIV